MLSQPYRFVAISGFFWVLAAVLFTAINVPETGWGALVVGGGMLLAGETTCAVGYLLIERLIRPITALALAGSPPPERCSPGVALRLTMTWSLGTGIPLLGILVVSTAGLVDTGDNRTVLAGAVAFLAAVGLLVGAFAISVAARSVADPITAVRRAMARVEEGDYDAEVPVDAGSEVGLLSRRLQLDGRRPARSASACATCSGATSAARWLRRRSSATATWSWAASCARWRSCSST